MSVAPRKYLISPLRAAVLTLVILACVFYYMTRPAPPAMPTESVVGDRMSACAFPSDLANTAAMREALTRMDGVTPSQFDEFRSWNDALKAGYRKCPETQLVPSPAK